jgi:hypothetical protein
MIVFSQIVSAAETAKSVQRFVEGQLVGILNAFGEVEYAAAVDALDNISRARKPANQVLLAVGHLQSAHVAYRKIHQASGIKQYFTLPTRMLALHKDIFTLCLMAICYRYLDEPLLMQDTLRDAFEGFRKWKKVNSAPTLGDLTDPEIRANYLSGVGSAIASWANAGSWSTMSLVAQGKFPEIQEEDLLRLCALLEYSPSPEAERM